MDKNSVRNGWTEYHHWERKRRRKFLRSLNLDSACRMFYDLWELHEGAPAAEISRLRLRRIRVLSDMRMKVRKGRMSRSA
jgi:hypothetical protein